MPKFPDAFADVLHPRRPHAPPGTDARCDAHRDPEGAVVGYPLWGRQPRLWRVRDGFSVRSARPRGYRLASGTLLRLDLWDQQGFRDGYFGESGDYSITERRFCVLDGPWAGTCWSNMIVVDMWDPTLTDTPNPVEPVPGSGS